MESPCFSLALESNEYFNVDSDDLFNVSSSASSSTAVQQPVTAVHNNDTALLDNFLATFPFSIDPTAQPHPHHYHSTSATTTPATPFEPSPFEPGLIWSPASASASTSPADQFLIETPGSLPTIDYSYNPDPTCGGGDYSLFSGQANSTDLWNNWLGIDGSFPNVDANANAFVPEMGMASVVDQMLTQAQAPAQVVEQPAVDASRSTRRSSPPRKASTKVRAKAVGKTVTPTVASVAKTSTSTKAKKASTVSRTIIRKKINEVMRTVTDSRDNSLYVCSICHPTLSPSQQRDAFNLVLSAPSIPKSSATTSAKQALAMSTRGIQRYDYNIRKHIAHHHYKELGVPPPTSYPCDRCDREFTRSHDRKVHITSVHERRDAFVCETCGEGFRRPGELENHKLDNHADGKEEDNMVVDDEDR